MKTIEDIKLKDILPDSIRNDATVSAVAEAIDPQLKSIAITVDTPTILTRIDELSSLALDHLATQYDVFPYRDNWSIDLKRRVIKANIANKRKKGTLSAIKAAIVSLGSSATIKEWWQTEPKGNPHTFTITVSLPNYEGVVKDDLQEDLIDAINDAKPVRSHYSFVLQDNLKSEIGVYGNLRITTVAKVRPTVNFNARAEGELGILTVGRTITKCHLIAQA